MRNSPWNKAPVRFSDRLHGEIQNTNQNHRCAQRELVIKQSSHYHTNESWATNNLSGNFSTTIPRSRPGLLERKKNVKWLSSFIWKLEATHAHQHVHTPARAQIKMWITVEATTETEIQWTFSFFCFSVMGQLNSHRVSVALLTAKPELEPACLCVTWQQDYWAAILWPDQCSAGLTCSGQPLRGPRLPSLPPSLPHCFHSLNGGTQPCDNTAGPSYTPLKRCN